MTLAPVPLSAHHLLDSFNCGRSELNEWLQKYARQAQAVGSAQTFVAAQPDGRVEGYFSLTAGQIEHSDATDRVRKGMGRFPIPVIVLARLAVSQQQQGRGMGADLLKDVIRRVLLVSEQAGVRAIITHPIDETAAAFYTKFGFQNSPVHKKQMWLLLKDAKRLLK